MFRVLDFKGFFKNIFRDRDLVRKQKIVLRKKTNCLETSQAFSQTKEIQCEF